LHSVGPLYKTCSPVPMPVTLQRVKPPVRTSSVAQLWPFGVFGGAAMTYPS
jgi:hypothetical protein